MLGIAGLQIKNQGLLIHTNSERSSNLIWREDDFMMRTDIGAVCPQQLWKLCSGRFSATLSNLFLVQCWAGDGTEDIWRPFLPDWSCANPPFSAQSFWNGRVLPLLFGGYTFFGHKDYSVSWRSTGKVTFSYSHLSNCHKSWAPGAGQTALPGHMNTKEENHLRLSLENSLFFGWLDNQKLALASAWSCVELQLQWTPTFSKLQNICCHSHHSKLLVL